MPLTPHQQQILALLATTRTPDSYLAGGAALHFTLTSARYSRDLDFFHDSAERVASAYADDQRLLEEAGFSIAVEVSQPGLVQAIVSRSGEQTRIEWAHDSAWRFMPPVRHELGGYLLHEIDLATNKALALAGRNEPRDFVDILFIHDRILTLGPVCWGAVGKDPGFTPLSLLELLRRRGRYQAEDFARLDLTEPFDLVAAKEKWLSALDRAEAFVRERPTEELGRLYYSRERERFVAPEPERDLESQGLVPHFGSPGGILPRALPE